MLTVTYDEGVNTGRIGPCKVVQLLSENPAKILGLYPKKGAIQKGSDADLVLFDPNQEVTLQAANLHSGAGYTPFEGRTCLGKLVLTMQRGRVLIEDGALKQKPGEAKFLSTKISKTTL